VIGQSQDGRLMAFAGAAYSERAIIVREWPSFKRVCALPAGHVTSVGFSGDGRYCMTGEANGTILIWDLAAARIVKNHATGLKRERFEQLWVNLGGDVQDCELAIDALVESSGYSVHFLAERLHPISDANVTQLITQLDANEYAERETAMEALRKMEFAAYEPLRRALDQGLPPESRRRVHKLLEALRDPSGSPAWQRQWHAVFVLEQIGGRETRRLLERLAEGAPAARLTRDARAALGRMVAKK